MYTSGLARPPPSPALDAPKTMPPKPRAERRNERKSTFGYVCSVTFRRVKTEYARTAREIGRMPKKRARHEATPRIQPERVGPTAGATMMTMPSVPIAEPRLSGGMRARITFVRSGKINAVPAA